MGKKIGLLWVNPYNTNRGVGALSYSVLYLLEKISEEYNIPFEYYLMGNSNETILNKVLYIGEQPVKINMIRTIIPNTLKAKIKSIIFRKDIAKSKDVDFVFDIGEGDSFSDIYGIPRFQKLNYTKKKYNKRGVKQMLLPQTIGPFKDPVVLAEAIKSMNNCQVILARDKQSYDFLLEHKITSKIDEIIDVAFFMPFTRRERTKEYTNVGINISALLWNGGYTQNNQFNLKADYQKLIKDTIDYFLSIPNVQVYLVPHVVGTNRNELENDYSVSYDLEREYNNENLRLSPFFLSPIDAKDFISSMDFFTGARMHAAIAAFSSEVPVVPMAYSRKFNGLFVDTLNYDYLGDLVNQDEEEVLNVIKRTFEDRVLIKEIIQNRMNGIVKEREKLLKQYIVDFLGIKSI